MATSCWTTPFPACRLTGRFDRARRPRCKTASGATLGASFACTSASRWAAAWAAAARRRHRAAGAEPTVEHPLPRQTLQDIGVKLALTCRCLCLAARPSPPALATSSPSARCRRLVWCCIRASACPPRKFFAIQGLTRNSDPFPSVLSKRRSARTICKAWFARCFLRWRSALAKSQRIRRTTDDRVGSVCFSSSIKGSGRSRFPVAVEQLYGVHRQRVAASPTVRRPVELLGSRQVVRHRILIPTFVVRSLPPSQISTLSGSKKRVS